MIKLFLLFNALAHAETYDAYDPEALQPLKIDLVEKAECVDVLQSILYSETSIVSGLKAIEALGKTNSTQTCLHHVLQEWSSITPEPKLEAAPSDLSEAAQILQDYENLARCTYPESSPGALDYLENFPYCRGKFLNQETAQALYLKFADTTKINAIFRYALVQFIRPVMELDELAKEGKIKLQCSKGAPPSGKTCDGIKLTEEEYAKLDQSVQSQEKEYNEKLLPTYDQQRKIQSALLVDESTISDYIYNRLHTLYPLAKKLACTPWYPEDSPKHDEWRANVKAICESIEKYGDRHSAREVFFAALGSVEEAQNENLRITNEKKKNRAEALEKFDLSKRHIYKIRRLLAQYHAFLEKGGSPEGIPNLCENYEKLQRRDQLLGETKIDYEKKFTPSIFVTRGDWKFAEQYGLTEGELKSLRIYLRNFFQSINPAIWGSTPFTGELRFYKKVMDAALDKLPSHHGAPLIRFADLPSEVDEAHQVNEIVTYPGYTSTSKKPDWTWEGKHRFVIYSGKNGKDVSAVNPEEQEVLFTTGTRFKVLAREKGLDGTIHFVLAEVDEAGNVIADMDPLP